ncbi:alpha/beta hydrolase [Bacillus sp. 31A1R]|uniref:Alpha/beta hydrolase n=1 Tax=Robertmurraya mangrovi TaxID=3098077 RepID=A0ABU5J0H0_9BACI|nr:alpha/beta hydrolase [Bacillus sp. 31A1R]MDZ5472861.1 alpha/beta hydrolase [Bacillus sp. 31A1R]
MALFLKKRHDFTIPEGGISSVETIQIGGMEQTILLQGEKQTNPVLLVVHGGPTMPLPGVSSRGRDYTIVTNVKELVKHFIVVFWDQRGTGRSYQKDILPHTMTIDQFVSDANELTDYLRTRFNQPKIFLAAHSWGTTVSLELVSKYPEKFYSYVGLSQIVSWTENDRLALRWIKEEAKRRGHTKALGELNSIGEPPFVESFKQWGILRKWQRKFNTLIYTDDQIKHPGLLGVSKPMFQSDDYTFKDILNSYYYGFKLIYTQNFIEELAERNFMETVKELPIPITLIHGKKDFHVHGILAEQLLNQLYASQGKQFVWVEKSAHLFHPDDTRLIEQYLINELRHIKKTETLEEKGL